LPLIFSSKGVSQNTRALLHAWGFYVVEKETSAPLLFAHSRSFPVMYTAPPPPQLNHLVLEQFAPSMGKPNWMCDVLRSGGVVANDCEGAWRAQWKQFWDEAMPRFDHVLMWDPTPEAQAVVPPEYRIAFQQDRLVIYVRSDEAPAAALTPLPELPPRDDADAEADGETTQAEPDPEPEPARVTSVSRATLNGR
jgi:hypothetical protein